MAKVVHSRVILKSSSAIVDNPSMGFTFASATATNFANISQVEDALVSFFNAAGTGGTNAVCEYLHPVVDRSANVSTIESYDITSHLDGSAAGAPVAVRHFTVGGTAAASGWPEGCAAALSIKAPYGTDVEFGAGTRPRARDRNRVYIGPLSIEASAVDAQNHTLLHANLVRDFLAAAYSLSVSHGSESWVWQVWSRKNAAVKVPDQAWMDKRPDYQRTRVDPDPASRVFRSMASV